MFRIVCPHPPAAETSAARRSWWRNGALGTDQIAEVRPDGELQPNRGYQRGQTEDHG